MLYSQTVDGRLVQVFSLDDARVDGVRVPMTPEQAHNPDVDSVARELIATATRTPLQQTVQLFAETEHIHDLLDAGNVADAFDALVTILHAARAIDPEHETGRDLESQLDWCERQMQAGHDMTKAIRNSISNVEDFAFDMEDMRRTRSSESPANDGPVSTNTQTPLQDMNWTGTYINDRGARFVVSQIARNGYLARYANITLAMTGEQIAANLASGEWRRV